MEILRQAVADGSPLRLCTGQPHVVSIDSTSPTRTTSPDASIVRVQIGAETLSFDIVLLATGEKPDCTALPLISNLLTEWPLPVVGGFPVVSTNCQWGDEAPVFVVGALASLQLGPGALNLMGARQGADIVASALGVYNDTSNEKLGGVITNAFSALACSSDDESYSSD